MTTSERRFPVGLTIAALAGFAILIGLGVWQLQRLAWKRALLARIESAASITQPITPVLARAARGENVEYSRVMAACAEPRGAAAPAYVYGLDGGQVVWRVLAACALPDGPYGGLIVDRGVAEAGRGRMAPPSGLDWPAVRGIVGVLRRPDPRPWGTYPTPGDPPHYPQRDPLALAAVAERAGLTRLAPYVLVADGETPAPAGLTPQALPVDIPNRHLEYALTWFALAAALAGVYLAVLWRRLKS